MSPFPRIVIVCASTVVATIPLGACAPSTRLASSWVDPTHTGHAYRKIAVVGITPSSTLRRQYENAFAAALEKRGTRAVASFALLGEGQAERIAADARLRGSGYATSPADSAANQIYRLESHLYDLTSERLVWSGVTETVLQSGDRSDDEIRPVIDELLAGMQKSKSLPNAKP